MRASSAKFGLLVKMEKILLRCTIASALLQFLDLFKIGYCFQQPVFMWEKSASKIVTIPLLGNFKALFSAPAL